jgi:hypothetical protein
VVELEAVFVREGARIKREVSLLTRPLVAAVSTMIAIFVKQQSSTRSLILLQWRLLKPVLKALRL